MGGSYSVERLTHSIGENAWTLFKSLESLGGICTEEAQAVFREKVNEKVQLRIRQFSAGEWILIGMNKFQDSENRDVRFKPSETYLGLSTLIVERDVILQS